MALSDPFSTVYEGTRQGLGAYGQAAQQVASQYSQRTEQEKLRKQNLMGALLGHFISKGKLGVSPDLLDEAQKQLGITGLTATEPIDIKDIVNQPGVKTKIDESGNVSYEYDPLSAGKEERATTKENIDILEKRAKAGSPIDKLLSYFGFGPVAEANKKIIDISSDIGKKESTSTTKKVDTSSKDKYGYIIGTPRFSSKLNRTLHYVGDNQWE